jgi:hypothetical protein
LRAGSGALEDLGISRAFLVERGLEAVLGAGNGPWGLLWGERNVRAAKRRGLVGPIRPMVQALRDHGFWIADPLVERALAAAGEM